MCFFREKFPYFLSKKYVTKVFPQENKVEKNGLTTETAIYQYSVALLFSKIYFYLFSSKRIYVPKLKKKHIKKKVSKKLLMVFSNILFLMSCLHSGVVSRLFFSFYLLAENLTWRKQTTEGHKKRLAD